MIHIWCITASVASTSTTKRKVLRSACHQEPDFVTLGFNCPVCGASINNSRSRRSSDDEMRLVIGAIQVLCSSEMQYVYIEI